MNRMRMLLLVPAAAMVVLAGCATGDGSAMGGPGMGGGPGSGPMVGHGGGSGQGMGMGGDMAQMCAMYREMAAGKSPAEQREAIEQRMRSMHSGSMTPEQMRMRREMMERNCAASPAGR